MQMLPLRFSSGNCIVLVFIIQTLEVTCNNESMMFDFEGLDDRDCVLVEYLYSELNFKTFHSFVFFFQLQLDIFYYFKFIILSIYCQLIHFFL